MRSSYIQNNFGNVFRGLILAQKPEVIVECGVLDGYSTYHIAHAVRFNGISRGIEGYFYAYDLFDDYEYKHGNYEDVKRMLKSQGLLKYVELKKGDAFKVAYDFDDVEVDFLHMDISNNGDTLIKTLEVWGERISDNGMIAFEGGSFDRDNVDWMKKYNFRPIRDALHEIRDWNFQVINSFPGLTLLFPKR